MAVDDQKAYGIQFVPHELKHAKPETAMRLTLCHQMFITDL